MKNILKKTKTYLVGSIQYENGEAWRNKVSECLKNIGVMVFNPYHKPFLKDMEEGDFIRQRLLDLMDRENYNEVEKRMREIRSYDLNLVDRSDFIIAYINPKVPTFGSMEELVTAVKMKKPTFISIEGTKKCCPLWLLGMFPHKYIYNNIDEMLDMILKIDAGKKEIDSNRWRLLKEEYR